MAESGADIVYVPVGEKPAESRRGDAGGATEGRNGRLVVHKRGREWRWQGKFRIKTDVSRRTCAATTGLRDELGASVSRAYCTVANVDRSFRRMGCARIRVNFRIGFSWIFFGNGRFLAAI